MRPTPDALAAAETTTATRQFVVFALGDESCAFPMEDVREIVRVPRMIPVPLGPPSLLGLANLRGTVLPVVDLRPLAGLSPRDPDEAARVLVVHHGGAPAGLLVDRVLRVQAVDAGRIEAADAIRSSIPGSLLAGVLHADGDELVLLLSPATLLGVEYGSSSGGAADAAGGALGLGGRSARQAKEPSRGRGDGLQAVVFRAAGEEYAIPIDDVAEVVRVPREIRGIPGAAAHVLGLVDLRGRALPLLSLRGLFRLPEGELDDSARVLVLRAAGSGPPVGIVVDGVQEVRALPREELEPTPGLLARSGGLEEITGICRLDGGERLVAVVDARRLLGHEAVRDALAASRQEGGEVNEQETGTATATGEDDPQFVVFELAGEEYCAPIEQVQEIIRVPERLNQVPGTPDFVEGLVNLRGTVLPVLDLRKRFALPPHEERERQRILVVEVAGTRTGLIVDGVSEVLRLPAGALAPAPAAAATAVDAVHRVANLPDQERMLFVLDVARVLDEGERGALDESMESIATATEEEGAPA